MTTQSKRWMFRLVLAVLAPAICVLAMEAGLRAAGLRSDPLLRVKQDGQEWITSNPRYGQSIFPREASPNLPALWIPAEKAPGEIRLVVLGESAAEGFPLSHVSLARVMESVMRHRYPTSSVRVISLAMAGINSHQLRQLNHAAAEHLVPDILVLYAGNNEVVGPFGPAAVMARFETSPGIIRFRQWIRGLALARVVDEVTRRRQAGAAGRKTWGGLDEFRGVYIAADDPRLAAMYRLTEANVNAIVADAADRGIKVLVATMGVNLNDWPPMASTPETEPAVYEVTQAPPPDELHSALVAYRWGESLRAYAQLTESWAFYRRAADLDLVRFRADTGIQDILRNAGRAGPAEQVRLVDIDRLMHESDPDGGDDRAWFYEHVHLNVPGRLRVANMLVDALDQAGWLGESPARGPVAEDELTEALVLTPMDELQALTVIREFYRWPHFTNQLYSAERVARLESAMQRAREQRSEWGRERLRAAWEASRNRWPADHERDASVGSQLLALGDAAAARTALEAALAINPQGPLVRADAARACVLTGDLETARRHLDAGLRRSPRDPSLLLAKGEWALATRQWTTAEEAFLQVHRLLPKHLGVLINLARLAEAGGDVPRAAAYYRQGLAISPDSSHLLNNFAVLLMARPEGLDEARALSARATELDPASPHVWWTHARVLARAGAWSEARAAAEEATARAAAIDDRVLLDAINKEQAAWPAGSP